MSAFRRRLMSQKKKQSNYLTEINLLDASKYQDDSHWAPGDGIEPCIRPFEGRCAYIDLIDVKPAHSYKFFGKGINGSFFMREIGADNLVLKTSSGWIGGTYGGGAIVQMGESTTKIALFWICTVSNLQNIELLTITEV